MAISVVKFAQVAQAAVLVVFVCAMPLCFGNMGAPELRTANGKFTVQGSNGPMESDETETACTISADDAMSFGMDKHCNKFDAAAPVKLDATEPQEVAASDDASCEDVETPGSSSLKLLPVDPPCSEQKGGFSAMLPFIVAFLAGGFFCLEVFEMLPVF
eukprot:gnl/MRDRNA2_/MRDRNA2_15037_c0_seq1.p1 gnl/MRDRNA2_/MRDRNA2_15037_c0~~gnl/MRDRNA2_/MRDRNA2_15037_c0_seq1.p1  ORF type:complete len:159 (+),score=39.11 gnl/MRDRNA2_/MRDRNA2_15037_c0_seq1:103-579(+)